MAILSTLKSRRLRSKKGETTQQVIVFQIRHEWFALPIFAIKKVVPQSDTHGDYHNSGTGLTVHNGKELLVLDISYQVFGNINAPVQTPTPVQTVFSDEEQSTQGYLMIIQARSGELVGLPVESAPTVRRFSESAIVPLPSNYAARVNIQCVRGLILQDENQPILFLLNPDQLLHAQPLLPPMS